MTKNNDPKKDNNEEEDENVPRSLDKKEIEILTKYVRGWCGGFLFINVVGNAFIGWESVWLVLEVLRCGDWWLCCFGTLGVE